MTKKGPRKESRPTREKPVDWDESWYAGSRRGGAPAVQYFVEDDYHTCRLCGEADTDCKVKYAIRHYAHPECYVKRWGRTALLNQHSSILWRLPVILLADTTGITEKDIVEAITRAEKAEDEAEAKEKDAR